MIKKFVTAAIIISSLTGTVVLAQPNKGRNIVTTPVSTFNKENLKMIKNNELTNDFLRIITFSQNDSNIAAAAEKIDYAKNMQRRMKNSLRVI